MNSHSNKFCYVLAIALTVGVALTASAALAVDPVKNQTAVETKLEQKSPLQAENSIMPTRMHDEKDALKGDAPPKTGDIVFDRTDIDPLVMTVRSICAANAKEQYVAKSKIDRALPKKGDPLDYYQWRMMDIRASALVERLDMIESQACKSFEKKLDIAKINHEWMTLSQAHNEFVMERMEIIVAQDMKVAVTTGQIATSIECHPADDEKTCARKEALIKDAEIDSLRYQAALARMDLQVAEINLIEAVDQKYSSR